MAVDMLTRADENTDAAPDVSIFPSAPDEAASVQRVLARRAVQTNLSRAQRPRWAPRPAGTTAWG
ncbi:MAG: hypothetical protein U0324_43235 [Polyangiales bacterium]